MIITTTRSSLLEGLHWKGGYYCLAYDDESWLPTLYDRCSVQLLMEDLATAGYAGTELSGTSHSQVSEFRMIVSGYFVHTLILLHS